MSEQVLCPTTGAATLNSAGITNNATVGGTLGVTGATTTAGITNTGNVGTGTLSTTGAATLNSAGVTNNLTVGGVTQLNGTNGLQFDAGQNVSEISTDGTLVDNSNTALPTEQAVKTYVDAQVGNQDLQKPTSMETPSPLHSLKEMSSSRVPSNWSFRLPMESM